MLPQMYTTAVVTLACIHLIISPCIASLHPDVWWFDEDGVFDLNDMCEFFDDNHCGIAFAQDGPCDSKKSCVDIEMNDTVWTIEQSGLQNMEGIDELSEFLFFVHYSSGSSVQCVVSHKFDTQSSYRVAPDESNSFEISIPIDHNATALYIKLETQGLAANDSDGCFWSGALFKYSPDGQCQDDGDECIYVIGMDDGNATDYVQEWHQDGCFETYPVYSRESNDSGHEYLCNNDHWYATDQNCSEFGPFVEYYGTGRDPHELGQCSGKADIFACGGRPVDEYDESTLQFVSDGDRYKRKMIVGCSEIDLFPAPTLPADAPSICVQLEILPDNKIWRQRML